MSNSGSDARLVAPCGRTIFQEMSDSFKFTVEGVGLSAKASETTDRVDGDSMVPADKTFVKMLSNAWVNGDGSQRADCKIWGEAWIEKSDVLHLTAGESGLEALSGGVTISKDASKRLHEVDWELVPSRSLKNQWVSRETIPGYVKVRRSSAPSDVAAPDKVSEVPCWLAIRVEPDWNTLTNTNEQRDVRAHLRFSEGEELDDAQEFLADRLEHASHGHPNIDLSEGPDGQSRRKGKLRLNACSVLVDSFPDISKQFYDVVTDLEWEPISPSANIGQEMSIDLKRMLNSTRPNYWSTIMESGELVDQTGTPLNSEHVSFSLCPSKTGPHRLFEKVLGEHEWQGPVRVPVLVDGASGEADCNMSIRFTVGKALDAASEWSDDEEVADAT